MLGTFRFALLAAVTLLAACGGGGGGDGGFLPDRGPAPLEITTLSLPDVVALPYATVLDASGGEGRYEWTLVSDGGTAFTLDGDGVLRADEAIPEGTYGLTFSVSDGDGRTAEKSLTIEVAVQPLAISITALPTAEFDVPYSAILEAIGGTEPYTWTLLDAGDTGFTLTSAGVLSGDPPTLGTYGITVSVTDDTGTDATRSLLLEVEGDAPQPLAISTTALPQANEGDRYAAVLAATGGTGDYSWQLTSSGNSGLSLSDDGVLRGTAPSEGVYGLTFRVDDGEDTVRRSLTLTVNGDDSPLVVETTALPDGVVGTRYAAVVTATGGSGRYSWTLLSSGGSGLVLSSNGVLSGTPGENGTFGVTVRVSDGEGGTAVRSLTVRFAPDGNAEDPIPLAITTGSLPNAEPGARYATVIAAEGGTGNYTWNLARDGDTGLTLDEDGVLTGTAPAPGNYGLTFEVNDGQATVLRSLTLSVIGDGPQALTVTTESVPNAIAGTRYATVLNASGGTGDYTWSFAVDDGGTGLTLAESGVLSGIAPAEGNYGLTVNVDDGEETVTRSLTLQVTGATQQPLAITTNTLPGATSGQIYAATLTAVGGTGDYEWSLVADGGSGLTVDENGSLRGTGPAPGQYALTVAVTDGINTVNRSLTLSVTSGNVQPLQIITTALPTASSGASFAAVLEATGGTPAYSWRIVNGGGTALSLSSDGVFSGNAPTAGEYGLTVEVEDSQGLTDRQSYTLTVATSGDLALQINTTTLPAGDAGELYAATLVASGGTGDYAWSLVDGGGTGLTVVSSGILRGNAPPVGVYGITVLVDDGVTTETASLTLNVPGDPLIITTTALPNAEAGESYAAVVEATGGDGSFTWNLTQDGGTGLNLTQDGVFSGSVVTAGSFGLTVEVEDGQGIVAEKSFVLLVEDAGGSDDPLQITTTNLPAAVVGSTYAAVIQAQGGSPTAYNWILIDDGGSGIGFPAGNNVLAGTPATAGNFGITVQVTDGQSSDLASFVLTVAEAGDAPLQITTTSLPSASTNTDYVTVLEAQGGSEPYTWELLSNPGSAPVTVDDDGILSGSIAEGDEGTYGLTFQVTDGNDTAAQLSLVLTINDGGPQALSIATETLPDIETNIYAAVLEAEGGVQPYSWRVAVGTDNPDDNPAGFDVSEQGAITLNAQQTPPPGVYPLTVEVEDDAMTIVRRAYSIVRQGGPQPAVEITTTELASATEGETYAYVLRATGGSDAEDAYTWSIIEVVPSAPGLTIGSTTGVLTWSSTDVDASGQPYAVTVQVVSIDATDSAATRTFTLNVN